MIGVRFTRAANPPSWLAMLHGLLATFSPPYAADPGAGVHRIPSPDQ
jgi:hypothetical protein